MFSGNGQINYVALRILNENCSTLASVTFIQLLICLFPKNTKHIEFFLGGVLLSVRKTYLPMGVDT